MFICLTVGDGIKMYFLICNASICYHTKGNYPLDFLDVDGYGLNVNILRTDLFTSEHGALHLD